MSYLRLVGYCDRTASVASEQNTQKEMLIRSRSEEEEAEAEVIWICEDIKHVSGRCYTHSLMRFQDGRTLAETFGCFFTFGIGSAIYPPRCFRKRSAGFRCKMQSLLETPPSSSSRHCHCKVWAMTMHLSNPRAERHWDPVPLRPGHQISCQKKHICH